MIHCIGDSHAGFFNYDKVFSGHVMGAMTAHNLKNRAEDILCVAKHIGDDDFIMLPHGETDCRFEIPALCNIEEAVKDTTDRYMEAILCIREEHKTIVWGPIAQAKRPLLNVGVHRDLVRAYSKNGEHRTPNASTQQERNRITELFTKRMSELCGFYGIPFVSIFHDMVDGLTTKSGWLDKKSIVFDGIKYDNWHLDNSVMPFVLRRFKELNLIRE